MAREILVNVEHQEKRVVIVNDGRIEEFYIERPGDKTIVGNIYKGTIEAALASINGAFVEMGMAKKGFLYMTEIESGYEFEDSQPHHPQPHQPQRRSTPGKLAGGIKKGQEVLVQVVKESFGTKGPRLSCHIGIPGRYLVIMPLENQVGISRRIENVEERRRLRQILVDAQLPKDIGFIVRTVAVGKSKNELVRDANYLIKTWRRIEKQVQRMRPPSLVYGELDLVLRVIRDSFSEDVHKLIVDSKPEFYRIHKFMNDSFMGHMRRKVEFYRGNDLFGDKDIERQITKVFETKVYMKSKAYIIIEPTEGLVVIDVNSGGFKERIDQEDAAFKINCEAAVEIAHQLRLRDLGGIIVVDFIDMEREGHRREVLRVLRNALDQDRAKYDILGISKFGLVEMTRERVHNTVHTMAFQACPYCSGRGKVKSPLTMSIFVVKELRRFLQGKQLRQVEVSVHPVVADEIAKDKEILRQVERRYRVRVTLTPNSALKIEDIAIA
ncbi:MAG TPA: Rne/Rng family ribonuclease [Candidatus Omnitrophota bacterium]|nr:Rne/Rng family ribonuclease [Candidatus Omnitrophota bacterium]HNQ51460.1 Rne/Rng family ribonuclease [Candidatus Omnitrophota bacterium]HQO38315.1 Rne/Rng family ribonuclease [Candidatus Omnitrophota bacterium]